METETKYSQLFQTYKPTRSAFQNVSFIRKIRKFVTSTSMLLTYLFYFLSI